MVCGPIDRIHCQQRVVVEIEHRKLGGLATASNYDVVIAAGESHHLQLDIELVGPEPRHLGVDHRAPHQISRRHAGLVNSVLHRLESQPASIDWVEVLRAVTHREDRRVCRTAVLVDTDAVVAGEPRALGKLDVGHHPHPHQHEITRNLGAVAERDASRLCFTQNAADTHAQTQGHPVTNMHVLQEFRNDWRD